MFQVPIDIDLTSGTFPLNVRTALIISKNNHSLLIQIGNPKPLEQKLEVLRATNAEESYNPGFHEGHYFEV